MSAGCDESIDSVATKAADFKVKGKDPIPANPEN